MSVTPPTRRRVHPAVTVRRAQSERRYLSPWQASCPAGPPPPPPPPIPSFLHPAARGSGWSRMDHHHHHAPRTAFIPPAHPRPHQPRMIGQSQMLLGSGMDLWGSVRYRPLPLVARAHPPPIALGPPALMLGPPPLVMPTMTLEDKLAQDRLTAFLAGETPPHRPRSILSCPESPLYESLVSCFSDQEDTLNFLDLEGGEHEYQQIEIRDAVPQDDDETSNVQVGASVAGDHRSGTAKSGGSPAGPPAQDQREEQPLPQMVLRRLNTLDVKPDRYAKDAEATEEACSKGQASSGSTNAKSETASGSSLPKTNSSQTLSSQENHKSAIYIVNSTTSSPDNNTSDATESDANQSPTVIHVSSSRKSSVEEGSSHTPEDNSARKTSVKHSVSLSTNESHYVTARIDHSSSSDSSKTSVKTTYSIKSGNSDPANKVQVMVRTKPPEVSYHPLTIELPETKETSWRSDHSRGTKNKSTQASLIKAPHIITTLDPPIKSGRLPTKTYRSSRISTIPYSVDVPLAVNFDSEQSNSDNDTVSSTATLDGSTSLYMTEEDDTTSIYSSAAEIYSVLTTDPDSLVYVYQPPPRYCGYRRESTSSYRYQNYILARGGGSSGESSGSESSWGGTVSFVEPVYRPSNLSVGSRGHLKFDYSWSWNRLDDFVRTTSPRDEGWYDYRLPKGLRSRQGMSNAFMPPPRAPFTRFESYSDPVAG
ncbi:uncharacterized protein [Panulirus ornatus]|uniref:uncharacterized protein n=1 Tax=Panulirus ornatus TaxID=150431 RepID=UPI003A8755B4